MLKKLFIFLIAIAPLAAVAQNANTVAYINTQEIFAAMPEIPGIETQLNSKQEQINKDGKALIDEFNKKAEEFEKTQATASDAVKADKQKELAQIQERYQAFVQNSEQEVGKLRETLLGPVQRKIADAIKAVGDENKYTYIFDVATMSSPLVYVSPSAVNATQLVKTKLGIK